MGRLWAKDASLWTGADESQWLGWLDLVADPPDNEALRALASQIRAEGITDVLLLGMGGSSLAPEVLSRVLPAAAGAPTLHVLDSTDPAQVGRIAAGLDLSRTACIVSSKSGTTLEPTILTEYFIDRIAQVVGADRVGSRFLAITDPGSALEAFARERQFRAVWPGVPSVGGRFSALSNFGVVPSALCGLDVALLVDRARLMADRCGAGVAAGQNPGVRLGLVLGLAAAAGRDKVTLLLSPAIAPLITVLIGVPLFALAAAVTGQLFRASAIEADGYVALAITGVLQMAVGRYSFYRSIQAMGGNQAELFQALQVPLSIAIALVFLDETLGPKVSLGVGLVMIGPILLVLAKDTPKASAGSEPMDKGNTPPGRTPILFRC